MITLASNSASPEELREVLVSKGIIPDEPAIPTETGKPSESAKAASPGESPSGSPADKTDPATETGEEPQGKQAASPDEPGTAKTPTPTEGKFEPRRKQLEKQVARLHEDLDLERGSKAALQDKLKAMEAELAALKPAEAEKPKADDAPVRPKMPKRADFDFDDEQYEAAMQKYDDDRDAYEVEMRKRAVAEGLEARDKQAKEDAAKEKAERNFAEFVKRRDESAKQVEDYAELREAAGDYPIPELVELKIRKSKVPALLIAYFDRDKVENDGTELARIAALEPDDQVSELTVIELELAGKKAPKTPVVDAPPVVDEAKPKPAATPAKPKLKPEDEPLEPLGGRTTGRNPSLGDAKTPREYIELRAKGISR